MSSHHRKFSPSRRKFFQSGFALAFIPLFMGSKATASALKSFSSSTPSLSGGLGLKAFFRFEDLPLFSTSLKSEITRVFGKKLTLEFLQFEKNVEEMVSSQPGNSDILFSLNTTSFEQFDDRFRDALMGSRQTSLEERERATKSFFDFASKEAGRYPVPLLTVNENKRIWWSKFEINGAHSLKGKRVYVKGHLGKMFENLGAIVSSGTPQEGALAFKSGQCDLYVGNSEIVDGEFDLLEDSKFIYEDSESMSYFNLYALFPIENFEKDIADNFSEINSGLNAWYWQLVSETRGRILSSGSKLTLLSSDLASLVRNS